MGRKRTREDRHPQQDSDKRTKTHHSVRDLAGRWSPNQIIAQQPKKAQHPVPAAQPLKIVQQHTPPPVIQQSAPPPGPATQPSPPPAIQQSAIPPPGPATQPPVMIQQSAPPPQPTPATTQTREQKVLTGLEETLQEFDRQGHEIDAKLAALNTKRQELLVAIESIDHQRTELETKRAELEPRRSEHHNLFRNQFLQLQQLMMKFGIIQ